MRRRNLTDDGTAKLPTGTQKIFEYVEEKMIEETLGKGYPKGRGREEGEGSKSPPLRTLTAGNAKT